MVNTYSMSISLTYYSFIAILSNSIFGTHFRHKKPFFWANEGIHSQKPRDWLKLAVPCTNLSSLIAAGSCCDGRASSLLQVYDCFCLMAAFLNSTSEQWFLHCLEKKQEYKNSNALKHAIKSPSESQTIGKTKKNKNLTWLKEKPSSNPVSKTLFDF